MELGILMRCELHALKQPKEIEISEMGRFVHISEWREYEAGWRFSLWAQWRIDTGIGVSGSVRHWNISGGKTSLAASNQDTPWFSSSLDCQVK